MISSMAEEMPHNPDPRIGKVPDSKKKKTAKKRKAPAKKKKRL